MGRVLFSPLLSSFLFSFLGNMEKEKITMETIVRARRSSPRADVPKFVFCDVDRECRTECGGSNRLSVETRIFFKFIKKDGLSEADWESSTAEFRGSVEDFETGLSHKQESRDLREYATLTKVPRAEWSVPRGTERTRLVSRDDHFNKEGGVVGLVQGRKRMNGRLDKQRSWFAKEWMAQRSGRDAN